MEYAKNKYKDNTGETLTSFDFNQDESVMFAEAYSFKKVPTQRFHYTDEKNFAITWQGEIKCQYGKIINEKYSYVPKQYKAEIRSTYNEMLHYGVGKYKYVDIEMITYSKSSFFERLSPFVIIATELSVGILGAKPGGSTTMNGERVIPSWAHYPQNGPLNKYKPGSPLRKRIGQ